LYDRLLGNAREALAGQPDESNAEAYMNLLSEHFHEFPDDLRQMREQGLVYVRYFVREGMAAPAEGSLQALIDSGHIGFEALVYEDFLPVSAAGIFQSNLGDAAAQDYAGQSSQADFETALGAPVLDELALYAETERRSLAHCAERVPML
jgi:uncharacterized glyoxalase superfamily metalloenzyme YdcJ